MRTLHTHEIQAVAGAGYQEDITTVAATLFVAGQVSRFAGLGVLGLGKSMALIAAGNATPIGWALGAITNICAPVAAITALFAVAAYMFEANPAMLDATIDKFHQYFG